MTKNWMKVLGVFAALAFVVGCQTPPTPTPECTTDAQCDDGLFCTGPEACVDNVCEQGTAPCNQLTQECDEETDTCIDLCTSNGDCGALEECVDGYCVAVECTTNADCDDGLFCTGPEACVDGACVEGTGPCTGEDESCDEDLDVCTVPGDEIVEANFVAANSNAVSNLTQGDTVELASPEIIDAAQVGDCTCLWLVDGLGSFDPQTSCDVVNYTAGAGDTEIRFYHICGDVVTVYTMAITVNEPAACTGDADCDTGYICVDGECIESTACTSNGDCLDDEYCDTTDNVCRLIECTTNADCDDGLWCDGEETCVDYVCVDGTPPCGDAECDEETETCAGETYRLTVGPDNFTGQGGNDYFNGTQDLTTPATPADTLNATDTLDGGAGTDTLYAVIANDVTPAKLANLEIIKYTMTAAKTLTATQATGLETLTNFASSAASVVAGLVVAPSTLEITNCANNTTVTITSNTTYPTLTGANDTLALNLDSATAGTVVVQPAVAGSGYETINLTSSGSIANSITLDDGNANSLKTLSFAGTANLTLNITGYTTVTTYNGAAATGNLTFNVVNASSTIDGGSGNDIFQLGGNYTAGTTDVDGGAGTDELQANSAQVVGKTATVSKVANIETIGVADALGGSLDITYFGATNTTLRAGSGAQTITMPTGGKLTFAGSTDTTGNVTVAAKTDTGADTLDVVFDASAGPLAGDSLLASTFETMNLEVKQNAAAAAINLSTYPGVTQTITVTGAATATITSTNVDVVNASATTGVQTWTLAGAGTLTGGSANDVLTGSAGQDSLTGNAGNDTLSGAAENDVLDGGAGTDTIQPGAGSDIMTGGTENDTFLLDGLTAAGSDTNIIKDFDAATSTTSADVFKWDVSVLEGLTAVTDLVDTSAVSSTGGAGDHVFKLQSSDGETITATDIVGLIGTYTSASDCLTKKANWTIVFGATMADDDAFLVAYTVGSNVHIAVAVCNGTPANSDGVDAVIDICKLESVSTSNLNTSDFDCQA